MDWNGLGVSDEVLWNIVNCLNWSRRSYYIEWFSGGRFYYLRLKIISGLHWIASSDSTDSRRKVYLSQSSNFRPLIPGGNNSDLRRYRAFSQILNFINSWLFFFLNHPQSGHIGEASCCIHVSWDYIHHPLHWWCSWDLVSELNTSVINLTVKIVHCSSLRILYIKITHFWRGWPYC